MANGRQGWLLVMLIALTLTAWAQDTRTYSNARYGYSLKFPASFTPQEEAPNGDGCAINSRDGRAEILVYGSNNIDDLSLGEAYDQALADVPVKPAYQTTGKTWFVISWLEDGTIHYRKTFVGAGSMNTFWFQYPKSLSKSYDPVATSLERSFSPGDLSRGH